MKKLLFIYCFVLLSSICFAQQNKDTAAIKERNWSLMLSGGTNYSYRYLAAKSTGPNYGVSLANSQEKPYVGFDFGAELIKKINKNYSLLFGFKFSQYVYRSIVLDTINWDAYKWYPNSPAPSGYRITPLLGYIPGWPYYQINSRYYFKEFFYHFPIELQYSFWNPHKINFVANVGISLGFLTEEFFIQQQDNTMFRALDGGDLSNLYFSVFSFVKVGALYKMSNRISFLLQPEFTYDLSGMYGIKEHIYSSEINASIIYKL